MTISKVAVLVAGSWGTALAAVLADNGHQVRLWTRNSEQADEINNQRTNVRFLGDVELSQGIEAVTELEAALNGAQAVIFVAPSAAMREVARAAAPYIGRDVLCIHATKGFESGTYNRMTTILAEELDRSESTLVVLSGPSHAEEVVRKQPTTVVVASAEQYHAESAQDLFINSYFRVYTNPDLIGVEVAGAIKNIIALGAGLSDGLSFGDNAKAALITRGLTEIARLGDAMGANMLTFAGLAGVGDLIVTCTSTHSRNWRAGSLLAKGLEVDEVLRQMGMVVEGIRTTRAAYELAKLYDVQMPITEQLYQVLFEGKSPKLAVEALMGRGRTHEIEEVTKAWSKHV
ncbi:NAD(P)H-dependent glycerol-3-phosphate dehydrogenase [Paenibacillus sp. GCM10012307]|uniref:NAD(P)H-dependent glycerol-3-phosphate dehydrogenase n=1 Tax=Paenibacillus TaxID=44249 RepID=UPI001E62F45A|nr:NAD(P)H-dependent glycerol-3-phosphate dehydrogenase [Paenibacillus roseus]